VGCKGGAPDAPGVGAVGCKGGPLGRLAWQSQFQNRKHILADFALRL
jgi:hypothetical protein